MRFSYSICTGSEASGADASKTFRWRFCDRGRIKYENEASGPAGIWYAVFSERDVCRIWYYSWGFTPDCRCRSDSSSIPASLCRVWQGGRRHVTCGIMNVAKQIWYLGTELYHKFTTNVIRTIYARFKNVKIHIFNKKLGSIIVIHPNKYFIFLNCKYKMNEIVRSAVTIDKKTGHWITL